MRAMILAAGLGLRLRPLTDLRPKPALPVRGVPLLAYALAWLQRQGVQEVAINLHHHPRTARDAAEAWCPPGLSLYFSEEEHLLDTGGGIRRVADFLAESDPALVIAGDMLVDFELAPLVEAHRAAGRRATLVLREDARAALFGTLGTDAAGRIRRIARRFDLGGERRAGLYVSANLFSPRAFESLPDREIFSHLDDWLAPELANGAGDIGSSYLEPGHSRWEPVGTPAEYLRTNLEPLALSYWPGDAPARARGTRFTPDLVVGAGAVLGRGVHLERAVVWDGERVPDTFCGRDGIFAGGRFHRVEVEQGVREIRPLAPTQEKRE